MQFFFISLEAINVKSLKYCINFIYFCLKSLITKNLVKKLKLRKLNKFKITLLKSAHIHKIAQEKFYKKLYKQQILIIFPNLIKLKFILIFKNLFNCSFYDIKLKFKSFLFNFNLNRIVRFLNLNNFCLNLNKSYLNLKI